MAAPDLRAARDAALRLGGAVALITQPYRVRGARAPGSAARQDEAWQEIIASLRDGAWLVRDGNVTPGADLRNADKRHARDGRLPSSAGKRAGGERPVLGRGIPLIVGGRSNGARVACRTAVAVAATGVIALAFPLRPPRPRGPSARRERRNVPGSHPGRGTPVGGQPRGAGARRERGQGSVRDSRPRRCDPSDCPERRVSCAFQESGGGGERDHRLAERRRSAGSLRGGDGDGVRRAVKERR